MRGVSLILYPTRMLLADHQIRELAKKEKMIEPFSEKGATKGVISYGLSSFGYDFRITDEFKIFTNALSAVVDPKDFRKESFVDFKGKVCIIPPNSFALTRSLEYVRVPSDILVIMVGKSTYARCGVIVNVTPLEPGWEGHITIEISNSTPLPVRIYANEGICQAVFFRGEQPNKTYAQRSGKYQKQRGITLAKVL